MFGLSTDLASDLRESSIYISFRIRLVVPLVNLSLGTCFLSWFSCWPVCIRFLKKVSEFHRVSQGLGEISNQTRLYSYIVKVKGRNSSS